MKKNICYFVVAMALFSTHCLASFMPSGLKQQERTLFKKKPCCSDCQEGKPCKEKGKAHKERKN